jgi:hypothetical protein
MIGAASVSPIAVLVVVYRGGWRWTLISDLEARFQKWKRRAHPRLGKSRRPSDHSPYPRLPHVLDLKVFYDETVLTIMV